MFSPDLVADIESLYCTTENVEKTADQPVTKRDCWQEAQLSLYWCSFWLYHYHPLFTLLHALLPSRLRGKLSTSLGNALTLCPYFKPDTKPGCCSSDSWECYDSMRLKQLWHTCCRIRTVEKNRVVWQDFSQNLFNQVGFIFIGVHFILSEKKAMIPKNIKTVGFDELLGLDDNDTNTY